MGWNVVSVKQSVNNEMRKQSLITIHSSGNSFAEDSSLIWE
jgi:hypothetical protein